MKPEIIDNSGLTCPQPVINTKKALDALDEGIVISIVDNQTAYENVSRLVNSLRLSLTTEEKEGLFYLTITKSAPNSTPIDIDEQIQVNHQRSNVNRLLLISSCEFGTGDPELGAILMKSLLYTAVQASEFLPHYIVLLNSGVKLTLPDAPTITHLRQLETLGVEIVSCGTCLDFYNIKDQSSIGRVTNMYEIYELLCSHEIIRI